jgi:hypothetical protein
MSQTITTFNDLDTFLQLGGTIDAARATLLLDLAYDKCSSVVSPVPAAAKGVMLEVAGRAYTNVNSANQIGIGSAHVSYAGSSHTGGVGGLYLSKSNIAELRRLAGGGGAFTIDPTASDAGTGLQPWDSNVTWLNGVPIAEDYSR